MTERLIQLPDGSTILVETETLSPIPKGSKILSAKFVVWRPVEEKTSAKANWDKPLEWEVDTVYDTPDFTQVIQEIVDKEEWFVGEVRELSWKEWGKELWEKVKRWRK